MNDQDDYADINPDIELADEHYWPGDGTGGDDLADYNQNEADDYRDEGNDLPDE